MEKEEKKKPEEYVKNINKIIDYYLLEYLLKKKFLV